MSAAELSPVLDGADSAGALQGQRDSVTYRAAKGRISFNTQFTAVILPFVQLTVSQVFNVCPTLQLNTRTDSAARSGDGTSHSGSYGGMITSGWSKENCILRASRTPDPPFHFSLSFIHSFIHSLPLSPEETAVAPVMLFP